MQWPRDPFRELERIRGEMDRMFSRVPFFGSTQSQFPLVNLYENADTITILAEVPGVKKEEIDINMQESYLILTGKRETPSYGRAEILRKEQPEGSFEKRIRIPVAIKHDQIKASYKDGVLSITLPKSEEAKPKQITIETE
ncbi:Hsp20/alpha crystallin family protein [Chitinispirillales bacterium ANBcel5]|uniref:Hsp20/alpha crystallin family protein n=1 Tax=Cellulosispirillum alkaliphilum TaxID=3039283 RepID=UPI002A54BA60|nr:Hsp20/alpha crystallin family protein [Chitinispirillales bacterium ANBcel5]